MGIASGRSRQLSAHVTSTLCLHQGSIGSSWVPTVVIMGSRSWGCRRGVGAAGTLLGC